MAEETTPDVVDNQELLDPAAALVARGLAALIADKKEKEEALTEDMQELDLASENPSTLDPDLKEAFNILSPSPTKQALIQQQQIIRLLRQQNDLLKTLAKD